MSDAGFGLTCCQNCGQRIEFPLEALGASVACPHCATETLLSDGAAPNSPPVSPDQITAGELKEAMGGPIATSRVPVLYQLGLILVAIFMVLLPLVYLAFVAFVGYATYWYAITALAWFGGFSGGVYVLMIKCIFYVGPLLGGFLAVIFMLKPLVARTSKGVEPLELNPAQHPRLYQFIAHISDLLHVRMPRTIYLDCNLGASVGFRRGWRSLLGNDLVMHLGLPLVAGLDTRQFAGVVAHELGHCTQSLALRLGYVIDRIDGWFGHGLQVQGKPAKRWKLGHNNSQSSGNRLRLCSSIPTPRVL